jgi:[ribosomal protein S5]-alanine N-acetyltransferase
VSVAFRALTPDDAGVLQRLHTDPDGNRFTPAHDPAEGRGQRMLDAWLGHGRRHGFAYELAVLDGEVVGVCGAQHHVWHARDVLNLYWRLDPAWWGRGLAHDLAAQALLVARVHRRTEPVIARIQPEHTASRRVAERLGLERDGTLDGRDEYGVEWVVYRD